MHVAPDTGTPSASVKSAAGCWGRSSRTRTGRRIVHADNTRALATRPATLISNVVEGVGAFVSPELDCLGSTQNCHSPGGPRRCCKLWRSARPSPPVFKLPVATVLQASATLSICNKTGTSVPVNTPSRH